MRILYYDCFSGISGDMNLGALIDLGVPREYLREELMKLKIEDLKIQVEKKDKMGIFGCNVDVLYDEGHVHRGIKEIKEILDNSELSQRVKDKALDMFMHIAKAEGTVHNKSVDEIHFHEVGAMDSIADVVGAAICLEYLKVDEIWCSTVQLGGGFVKCAHGVIPVPAPAVCEILKDVPVKSGVVQFETTTPTGAAILKSNVKRYIDNPQMRIEKIGYGIGDRDMDIPNVLRVFIGDVEEQSKGYVLDRETMIECNIDDMKSERLGFVMNKLLDLGAKDVFFESIFMKKNRPALKMSVLVSKEKEEPILECIFKNTTSIGVRKYAVDKVMMKREIELIQSPWGDIRVKKSYFKDGSFKFKGEFDDIEGIMEAYDLTYEEVERYIAKCILND